MSELSKADPTGRFSGLADIYAKHRPSYPEQAIQFIMQRCGLVEESILIDIGSGTGISSRLFANLGVHVIGIEPNSDMREKAQADISDDRSASISYVDGQAESTGLPAAHADAVLCAQSFHWFDADKALAEFRRILKPNGWVVLMWNERDESDPFTNKYGDLFHTLSDTSAVEVQRGQAGKALLQTDLFSDGRRSVFSSQQLLDEDGLVGRALSASYAPKEKDLAERFEGSLRKLFKQSEKNGTVNLIYETSVYTARRRK